MNSRLFHFLFFVSAFSILVSSSVTAQQRPSDTELGVIVGEPTGISAKFWVSQSRAYNFGAAWSFGGQSAFHGHADYLFHNFFEENNSLNFYYGIGGRVLLHDDPKFGVRFPLGLQYMIPESRLSLFFEVAPILQLLPGTDFDANGGIGVRIFI